MNGRKAKLLRKLAGVSKSTRNNTNYEVLKGSMKEKKIEHPNNTELDSKGNPVLLGTYHTATLILKQGERALNKMLKKQYKKVFTSSTKSMLTA